MWTTKIIHPSRTLLNVSACSSSQPKPYSKITNVKSFSTQLHKLFNVYSPRLFRDLERKYMKNRFFKCKRASRLNCSVLENSKQIQVVWGDFNRSFYGKGRDMLLSAACISVYNWDKNSLHENNDIEHLSDLEFVYHLTTNTITCKSCHQRIRIDQKLPNINYCTCSDGKALQTEVEGWKPFIERPSALVWRKEHESYKGLYIYKMYGRLEEISALDYMRVQLDTNFRKRWDSSATELMIVEENKQSNYDIVYWEMQWPKPFANRDYVFQRRLTYDPKALVCLISSEATSHPSYPVKKSSHRVNEYYSYLVVKPFTEFKKPGVEFVLTYFDNPGLSIPSTVSTWVAMTGLPNFNTKLQEAATKVSGLDGPEPTLLQCLLEQLDARKDEALTAVQQDESIVVQLAPSASAANEDAVIIEEERSTLVVEPATSAEEMNQPEGEDISAPSVQSAGSVAVTESIESAEAGQDIESTALTEAMEMDALAPEITSTLLDGDPQKDSSPVAEQEISPEGRQHPEESSETPETPEDSPSKKESISQNDVNRVEDPSVPSSPSYAAAAPCSSSSSSNNNGPSAIDKSAHFLPSRVFA